VFEVLVEGAIRRRHPHRFWNSSSMRAALPFSARR
jgi:hypothetical protein